MIWKVVGSSVVGDPLFLIDYTNATNGITFIYVEGWLVGFMAYQP